MHVHPWSKWLVVPFPCGTLHNFVRAEIYAFGMFPVQQRHRQPNLVGDLDFAR
jgi:hypothetical protein